MLATPCLRKLRQTQCDGFAQLAMLVGIIGLALLWSVFAGDLGTWYMD